MVDKKDGWMEEGLAGGYRNWWMSEMWDNHGAFYGLMVEWAEVGKWRMVDE